MSEILKFLNQHNLDPKYLEAWLIALIKNNNKKLYHKLMTNKNVKAKYLKYAKQNIKNYTTIVRYSDIKIFKNYLAFLKHIKQSLKIITYHPDFNLNNNYQFIDNLNYNVDVLYKDIKPYNNKFDIGGCEMFGDVVNLTRMIFLFDQDNDKYKMDAIIIYMKYNELIKDGLEQKILSWNKDKPIKIFEDVNIYCGHKSYSRYLKYKLYSVDDDAYILEKNMKNKYYRLNISCEDKDIHKSEIIIVPVYLDLNSFKNKKILAIMHEYTISLPIINNKQITENKSKLILSMKHLMLPELLKLLN